MKKVSLAGVNYYYQSIKIKLIPRFNVEEIFYKMKQTKQSQKRSLNMLAILRRSIPS